VCLKFDAKINFLWQLHPNKFIIKHRNQQNEILKNRNRAKYLGRKLENKGINEIKF